MPAVAKRNGRWRVRWYEPDGTRKSRTFDRKVDATKWATKVGHDRYSGSYVSSEAGRRTFKSYAEEWRKTKAHRPTTAQQVESHLRLHVYPEWENRSLASITPADVQRLVSGMSLGPAATEVTYAYVANIFKRAVRDRLLPSSPCVDIELPEKTQRAMQLLSVEQVVAVGEAMDPRHRVFVAIASRAGLRPSEVTGLRTDRVDVAGSAIRVDTQLVTLSGSKPSLEAPKTVTSSRIIPVDATVVAAIEEHLDTYGAGPWGLVMSTRSGGPVRRNRLNESWRAALRKAEGPAWARPHDLRHFYASLLIRQGLDVKTVQRRLGHKSAVTTLDTYATLWPDDEDRTRDAIEAAFSDPTGPQRDPGNT